MDLTRIIGLFIIIAVICIFGWFPLTGFIFFKIKDYIKLKKEYNYVFEPKDFYSCLITGLLLNIPIVLLGLGFYLIFV